MRVTRTSQITGATNQMDLDVTPEMIQMYELGMGLIQDIFPHLDPEEREFLKTGITPEEWNTMVCPS